MKLNAKQRASLPDSDFGIPETRQFPIHDKNHVRAAARYIKYAPPGKKKELIKNINKRAKELGMNLSVGEASNVGTLEPIVGASETIIPAGGTSYLSGEDNPSFGAKVMDYVLRRKIVREDTVVDEGLVFSNIKYLNPDECSPSWADYTLDRIVEEERKKIKASQDMRTRIPGRDTSLFTNFEKQVTAIITRGQTKDMIKYLTLSDKGDHNYRVVSSWNYNSMNAATDIVELLHNKELEDEDAGNRIYQVMCNCPESDFTYLMATLYRAIYNDDHATRFWYVANNIAKAKTVCKGINYKEIAKITPDWLNPAVEKSKGFTSEEINKLQTCFSENFDAIWQLLRIWDVNRRYITMIDLTPMQERNVLALESDKKIKGYALISDSNPNAIFRKSILFVKDIYSERIGIYVHGCDDNTHTNYRQIFHFYDDDITKLVDIALRVKAKYRFDIPMDIRAKLRDMFDKIGRFMPLDNVVLSKVNESVSSIFKDVKRGVLSAMRRIHVEKDGEVSINLKDELTLANYSETHRLLMADLESDDVSGLKLNVAYVFSLITIIETRYVFGKNVDKYSQEYKDAIKLRGMLISDFNQGLNAIRAKEPSFSFIKFYKDSGFEAAVYKFNAKTITDLSSTKLVETVFQNALKFRR